MGVKVDVVTQEESKNSFLIIGLQVGMLGYVIRLGLYKQYGSYPENSKLKIKIKK